MVYYTTGQPPVPAFVRCVPVGGVDARIRSFAHTSLIQAPSNPHYGARGSYRFCTHYYRLDRHKYERCKDGREDCLGEMFDEASAEQIIRRLTYNPLFEALLDELGEFMKSNDI
jgi:hypothetical protein